MQQFHYCKQASLIKKHEKHLFTEDKTINIPDLQQLKASRRGSYLHFSYKKCFCLKQLLRHCNLQFDRRYKDVIENARGILQIVPWRDQIIIERQDKQGQPLPFKSCIQWQIEPFNDIIRVNKLVFNQNCQNLYLQLHNRENDFRLQYLIEMYYYKISKLQMTNMSSNCN